MEKTSPSKCPCANGAGGVPSFLKRILGPGAVRTGRIPLPFFLGFLPMAILVGGCGADAPKPSVQAETKPAEPAISEEIQSAAKSLLGSETQVLAFGDLAKNGNQEFLAANVVPKTPTNNLPGTIVTRDRKSTRLNSSHLVISYAVFCLKKKKIHDLTDRFLLRKERH